MADFIWTLVIVTTVAGIGMAIACILMWLWVKQVIKAYIKAVFRVTYNEFVRKIATYYDKHDKDIKELRDECKKAC